jgi:AraC-like DNA-binding protein
LISVLVFLIFSPDVLYGYINRRDNAEIIQAELTSVPDTPSTSEHRSLTIPIDEIIQKLESYVKNNKPFLQTGYTIHDLSKEIEIPVYQLSYAINHVYDMHFSNWLNHQRIEYFLQTAGDKHHMTLEAMAREAGFSNRITFINAFKKEKGITPGQYLKLEKEKFPQPQGE